MLEWQLAKHRPKPSLFRLQRRPFPKGNAVIGL